MSTTKAGAKWGDARVAFRVIAAEVMAELERGRTVRSVYEDMKPRFPAGYAQFAKYVQRSTTRTEDRRMTPRFGSTPAPPSPPKSPEREPRWPVRARSC